MPDTKKIKNTKIAFIMLSIMAVAAVLSFTARAFAQDKPAPASGMERVIKGTENWNGKYDISISKFLKNQNKQNISQQKAANNAATANEAYKANNVSK